MDSRVKVAVRVRPLLQYELESGSESIVKTDKDNRIAVQVPARNNVFEFDWTYNTNALQQQIYEDTCRPLVDNFFKGFNATILAYGQTGSGKTYTMGNAGADNEGIIQLAVLDIFKLLHELNTDCSKATLHLSYTEIYKEECFDLLSDNRTKLDIRENNKGESFLDGLIKWPLSSASDVQKILRDVSLLRATGKTAMNSQSSRSHALCTFYLRIETTSTQGSSFCSVSTSKLHLVDLAGCERAKKTQASGSVFREGVDINKGLLALGNVINALAIMSTGNTSNTTSGLTYIPYRDSKLTRVLKDSLGGNGVTVMIACVSPADMNAEETINTLRFASRASTIVNSCEMNKEVLFSGDNGSNCAAYLNEISTLRDEIEVLKKKIELNKVNASHLNHELVKNEKDAIKNHRRAQFTYLTSMMKFIVHLRSNLITCIEEDVEVDDSDMAAIKQSILELKLYLKQQQSPRSDIGDNAMVLCDSDMCGQDTMNQLQLQFLPPIMTLVDDLEGLRTYIQQLPVMKSFVCAPKQLMLTNGSDIGGEQKSVVGPFAGSAESASDLEEIDEDGYCQAVKRLSDSTASSHDEHEYGCAMSDQMSLEASESGMSPPNLILTEQEELMSQSNMLHIQSKEEEVARMVQMTEECKRIIAHLREEVDRLKHDGATAGGCGKASTSSNTSLTQKAKLLEEKLKELRKKEVEYAHILQQKEKALREISKLQQELDTIKLKKVQMQKKWRDDAVKHEEERKRLIHAEIQSKKREQLAKEKEVLATKQLMNKDKVWNVKLAEKDMEIKRLKDMTEKQDKVRLQREKMLTSKSNNANSGQGGASSGNALFRHGKSGLLKPNVEESVGNDKAIELQDWIEKEIYTQSQRNVLQENIQLQMDLRTKESKRLNQLKLKRDTCDMAASSFVTTKGRSEEEIERDNEMKTLEEQIRIRSNTIAKEQGQLADLGQVIERRRFATITDIRDSKVLLGIMFQKLSYDQIMEQRALEAKIAAQESEISQLKTSLQQTQPHAQTTAAVPIKRRRSLLASDKDHFSEGAISEKNNVLITRDTISASNTLSQNQSANVVSVKKRRLSVDSSSCNATSTTTAFGSRQMQHGANVSQTTLTINKKDSKSGKPMSQQKILKNTTAANTNLNRKTSISLEEKEHFGDGEEDDVIDMLTDDDDDFDVSVESVLDDLDESFYPEEEVDDDDDDDKNTRNGNGRLTSRAKSLNKAKVEENDDMNDKLKDCDFIMTVKAPKKKASKRSRHELQFSSNDNDTSHDSNNTSHSGTCTQNESSMDDGKGIVAGEVAPPASASASSVSIAAPMQPLTQYRVQDLKKFLQERQLTSTGRKDELISRLQQYLDGESEGNNNREMSVAEPQNASKGVSKSKQPRATSVFDKENVMQQLTNITEILGDQKSTGLEKKSRKLLSKNVMFLNIEDADEVVGLND